MSNIYSAAVSVILYGALLVAAAQTNGQSEATNAPQPVRQAGAERMTFEPLLAGSGKEKGGVRFSFQDYKASDGVALSVQSEQFTSPEGASRAFKRRLRNASKIIERGANHDGDENEAGERAVLYTSQNSNRKFAMIIRINGATLYSITSPSLKHALAFEGIVFQK